VTLNARRRWFQASFFALFILAPPLDLFRLDLTLGHFILFGQDWTLGLDDFLAGNSGPADAVWNILWRGFLPIALVIGGGIYAAWRWGRLYCGWLFPSWN
jgi:ferredoxin-type protein NapH